MKDITKAKSSETKKIYFVLIILIILSGLFCVYTYNPAEILKRERLHLSNLVPQPRFSKKGGFYEQKFELTISAPANDLEIFYTLDGSLPDRSSLAYKKPIEISSREGIAN